MQDGKWAHIRINPSNRKLFVDWKKTNPYASSLCHVANVALSEFFDRALTKRQPQKETK